MNDSDISTINAPQAPAQEAHRWLFLIHQLPPKPDYLRVKVRRRLHQLGAVPLKNSVYVLPLNDAAIEDFQWLSNEIVSDGGEATICSATLVSGVADEDLAARFRDARRTDFLAIADAARALVADDARSTDDLTRMRRRLGEVDAIDYFKTPERSNAERALEAAERRLHPAKATITTPAAIPDKRPRNATWVTRRGVFIDRIASAWLIRRFIDRGAKFRFVAHDATKRIKGMLRFDMYGGEFTHVGERCTFENLVARFCPDDAALQAIGEVVHDIDCKDDKFSRRETPGVAAVIQGIASATDSDSERITRGAQLFDALYGQMGRER